MTRTVPHQRRAAAGFIALATALFLALSMVAAGPAHADYSDDERFVLLDRSDDSRIAYVHGDHWHGSLPTVPLEDRLSLGAQILDADGNELALDGSSYSLGVALASGADDGVLELVEHGDHVHLRGSSEGDTSVVFQLVNDGDVEYETPAMAVTVSADADDHGHEDEDDGHSHDDEDNGHSHDEDGHEEDEAPAGGVDAGFGGSAISGLNATTVLLVGMLVFALLAAAVAMRPAGSAARR